VNSALNGFVPPGNQGSNRPAAYLNYILFDANYNVLDVGAQVAPATTFTQQKLSFNTLNIKEPGYVFVYLSYDNESSNWVYFDDFKITHNKSNVIQYNEYYPFGMQTAKSWTRDGSKNDYLYNAGNEMNSNTGWYETFFRGYDATLGKFLQTDPMADKYGSWTPYNYAFNDPVYWNDPMGDDASDASHGFNWYDVGVRYPEYMDASVGTYGYSWNLATYGSAGGAGGGAFGMYGVGAWKGPTMQQMQIVSGLRKAGINISVSKWGFSYPVNELEEQSEEDKEFIRKTGAYNAGGMVVVKRIMKHSWEKFTDGPTQGGDPGGENALNSAFTVRSNDVGVGSLFFEYLTGTGPEYSMFKDGHPMVNALKDSHIVSLAKIKFVLGGSKPLIQWDAPFGIVGAGLSNALTEQFVGGARVSIIPTSMGNLFIVDNTTGRYSFHGHSQPDIPRNSNMMTPEGNIYQRFIWLQK
jgi:RHS repeat-associated protein